jgi:CheY-like chemotaxis protein
MRDNKRILLVDDEPYNILGLKIVLQQSGIKNLM